MFSFVVISRISGRCMMGNSYWYNNVMGKSNERVFWGTRSFGKYNRGSNTQLERLARATWRALDIRTEKITIFTKRRNKTSYRGLKSRCICEKLLWGSGRIYPYHPDPPHHLSPFYNFIGDHFKSGDYSGVDLWIILMLRQNLHKSLEVKRVLRKFNKLAGFRFSFN